jgi:sugar PTS system EIIA component
MFSIFKKKKKVVEIKFPVRGEAVNIAEVPDEVFATKMVGDGAGFIPMEGVVYSPVDGEIVQLFPSKHAVGIKTEDGLEILIHIGVDTVHMNGDGFEYLIKQNQSVKAGDKLMKFDIDLIKKRAKSIVSPMLFTNMEIIENIEFNYIIGKPEDVVMVVELK